MVVVDMEYCFPVHDIVEDTHSDIATSTYIETVGMDDQHYGINNENNATVPGLPQYEYGERDYIPRITPPSSMMIQTLIPIPTL